MRLQMTSASSGKRCPFFLTNLYLTLSTNKSQTLTFAKSYVFKRKTTIKIYGITTSYSKFKTSNSIY